jgi:hypothetical protein
MVIQLLVSSFVSAINIMVHALATVAAVSVARRAGLKPEVWPRLHLMGRHGRDCADAHAGAHDRDRRLVAVLCHDRRAPESSELLYFAFVNYTRLAMATSHPSRNGGWSARWRQ